MPTLLISILGAVILAAAPQSPSANALRIIVVEGEDAVNIIQQKTAVAPVVEIRDRNNLPVSGVAVTFSVSGPGASFGGVSTLTVTTNAAGQAAAVGFTPTAAGAIQINASALVQGQALTATITQTNVLTAAQAAGAAGGGAAGGGAAGGGGGMSATTIGLAGAAVAGGAVAATQLTGGEDPPSSSRVLRASYASAITLTFQGCTRVETWSGTLEFTLASTEPIAGNAAIVNGTTRVDSVTCTGGPQAGNTIPLGMRATPLTGTAANIGFLFEETNAFAPSAIDPLGGTTTVGFKFEGAFSGNEVTGTLSHSRRIATPGFVPGVGSASVAVTLR